MKFISNHRHSVVAYKIQNYIFRLLTTIYHDRYADLDELGVYIDEYVLGYIDFKELIDVHHDIERVT